MTPNAQALYLGIDGGGTKCNAILVNDEGQVLGRGTAGPANPYHGYERAIDSITLASDIALKDAGLEPSDKSTLIAGLGLAGLHLPSQVKKMEQWQSPFAKSFFTNDLHIACIAAHESNDGGVIISGTGSCGFAHVDGQSLTLGGHGIPCGDKGSGAWIGLSAVQAVLLASDHLGPATLLQGLLEEQLEAKGMLIVDKLSQARSSDFAELAALVFRAAEQQDEVALGIIQEGADYLSALGLRLLELSPPRISLLGGIADQMIPWLNAKLVERLSPAKRSAEFGAIQYARSQLTLEEVSK
jgi:glucosamine kinase